MNYDENDDYDDVDDDGDDKDEGEDTDSRLRLSHIEKRTSVRYKLYSLSGIL